MIEFETDIIETTLKAGDYAIILGELKKITMVSTEYNSVWYGNVIPDNYLDQIIQLKYAQKVTRENDPEYFL